MAQAPLRFLKSFLLPILIGVLLGGVLIVIFEDQFVYYPYKYPKGTWDPSAFFVRADDCYFTSSDGVRLHGWFVPATGSARGTLVWFHGNAGNITHRLDNIKKLERLQLNIFIFDYRGYGRSEGTPGEEGLYRDARAAYAYLLSRSDVDTGSLIFFGRSLGAAVALDLAIEHPPAGLVLETPFTSARDMASLMLPFLPLKFAIRSQFNSIEKIRSLQSPLLVIHGTVDRTVPISLGRRIFDAAPQPKDFYEIPGADHNDTYLVGGWDYFERINRFVTPLLAR